MEEDSPLTKTVKGAVTGLATGTIWGTVVATWYDVPRVERHVALPGLIRTPKMCGTYRATFATIGGLYIGVEQLVQSQRKKRDFVNGAVGAFVAGSADDLMPPYCSITDYLQGFLQDPSGLARHLDAPCPAEDAPLKHELSVDVSHDSQGTSGAPGEGAATMHTPNSSVSLSSSDREGEGGQPRRCKKGRPKAEDAEGDEKDQQEDGENSTKAWDDNK